MSVSNRLGFVAQSEQFEDRKVASEDTTNYKIVEYNDFAYNPARINVGSIARMSSQEQGIISPMYTCFRAHQNVLPEFLEFFFSTKRFDLEMKKRLEGSVRQCLSFEGLGDIQFPMVEIEAQRKVILKVRAIVEKINIESRILDLLIVQKRQILNMMFI